MNVLVTGGAGFIGSHLVDRLLEEDDVRVVSIDNFDPFYQRTIKEGNIDAHLQDPNFRFVELDIRDQEGLGSALADESIDTIVHIAAKAGVRPSIEAPLVYHQVNVDGTLNLLQWARKRGITKFIFASSSSVYGVDPNVPWQEKDTGLMPISPYAASKIAGENYGRVFSNIYGVQFIALRFFTVYGPRQRPDLAIHKFFRKIANGEVIDMYGDGTTRRDYTYVADVIQGVRKAMDLDGPQYDVFNLGNSDTIMLKDLIAGIEEVLGKQAIINQMPEQTGDVPQTYADISKARRVLGYDPQTKIDVGLRHFNDWFQQNATLV